MVASAAFSILICFVTVGYYWLGVKYPEYCERPVSQGWTGEEA